MEKLQELLESNAELKAKIETLNKDPQTTAADFIALVREYGVEITEADFRPTPAGGEVSDSELEAVAGGGKCVCVAGGGGKEDASHGTCACVVGGCGLRKDTDQWNLQHDCKCPLLGSGKGA